MEQVGRKTGSRRLVVGARKLEGSSRRTTVATSASSPGLVIAPSETDAYSPRHELRPSRKSKVQELALRHGHGPPGCLPHQRGVGNVK